MTPCTCRRIVRGPGGEVHWCARRLARVGSCTDSAVNNILAACTCALLRSNTRLRLLSHSGTLHIWGLLTIPQTWIVGWTLVVIVSRSGRWTTRGLCVSRCGWFGTKPSRYGLARSSTWRASRFLEITCSCYCSCVETDDGRNPEIG